MDDLERDLRGMLNDRVSGMPDSYDAAPELVSRSHRRRATKLTSIGVAAVVVAVGVTGAVVRSVAGSDAHHLSTTKASEAPPSAPPSSTLPPRPAVPTVRCPVNSAVSLGPGTTIGPPATGPRVPAAGDAGQFGHLASFAATNDPRYVVLGPAAWSCLTSFATDSQNGVVIYDPAKTPGMVPDVFNAPIAILNDWLWHGGVGSTLACSVFDDPAVVQYVSRNFPQNACPSAGRTVTKVDAHVSTFVDADGARGAGWIVLPSSPATDDGKVSVLTCRPTEGLTAAGCDAIIADFVARNDPAGATPTSFAPSTSTAAEPGAVPGFMCHGVTAATPSPSVPARTPSAGDPTRFAGLASFLANIDGDPRFIVLGPRSWSCEALVFQDGRDAVIVFDPASPPVTPRDRTAPISIENDYLWHGGIGSVTACAVFDDSALVQFVTRNYPVYLPCPGAGRTVTRVDAHVSTFVDTDGARGAGWIVLPSSQGRDGVVSVLTCRPTAGLTAADCDSIVADWAARANAPRAPG